MFTCQSAVANGGSCTYNSDCQSHLCTQNAECANNNDGDICASADQCGSGVCNSFGHCGLLALDFHCLEHTDCVSHYCSPYTSVCEQDPGNCGGQACVAGWSCQSDRCIPPNRRDTKCSPSGAVAPVDCTYQAVGGHCDVATGLCSITSCSGSLRPLQGPSGIQCSSDSSSCGYMGNQCTMPGTSCQSSGSSSYCALYNCPSGTSPQSDGTCLDTTKSLNPAYAYPNSATHAGTGKTTTFITTCCSPGSRKCYNQMAQFRSFNLGESPLTRKPDVATNICNGMCPFSKSITDQVDGYSWQFVPNLFDRNHLQPAIYMGPMIAFDNKDPSNINCQTADQSLIYYDSATKNPCVANVVCSAIPDGGLVSLTLHFSQSCGTNTATINYSATLLVYYANSPTPWCTDTFANIGYQPGTLTSSKCNAQVSVSGHGGDFTFNYVTYANGYRDTTAHTVTPSRSDGSCASQTFSATFNFDPASEAF